jgi:putative membrane protein
MWWHTIICFFGFTQAFDQRELFSIHRQENHMTLIAQILTGLVLLIHVYIVLLETVLFKARGGKVFGLKREQIEAVAPAMFNQGFYNAFLVAALVLGFTLSDPAIAHAFLMYGLGCVAVAGIVGGLTVQIRILYVQTVPAAAALMALFLARQT